MANIKTVRFTNSSRMVLDQLNLSFGDGTHSTVLPIDHDYDLDVIGPPYIVYATLTASARGKEGETITKTIDLSTATTTTTTTLAPGAPLAYWSGDDTIADSIGGRDAEWFALFTTPVPIYAPGFIAQCFDIGNVSSVSYLKIPYDELFDPWINPEFELEIYWLYIPDEDVDSDNSVIPILEYSMRHMGYYQTIVFSLDIDSSDPENPVIILSVQDEGEVWQASTSEVLNLVSGTWYKGKLIYNNGTWTYEHDDSATDISLVDIVPMNLNGDGRFIFGNPFDSYSYSVGYADSVSVDEIKFYSPFASRTLVAWYKGDDNTIDSIHGNDAIWKDGITPSYDTGIDGDCFKFLFPGFYSIITIPYTPLTNVSGTDNFAITLWNKGTEPGSGGDFHISCSHGAYEDIGNKSFKISCGWVFDDTSEVNISILGVGTQTYYIESGVVDDWRSIKITYNNGRWEFYLNDAIQFPNEYVDLIVPVNTDNIYVGSMDLDYGALVQHIKFYKVI